MALWRLGLVQGCRSLNRLTPITTQIRTLKTTKKEGYGEHQHDRLFHPDAKKIEKLPRLEDKEENWISFGFSVWNKADDLFWKRYYFFWIFTWMFCVNIFIIMFNPDKGRMDWTTREAYLQIEERERLGLPHIDPQMIPLEQIESQLPTDEELGDTDIII